MTPSAGARAEITASLVWTHGGTRIGAVLGEWPDGRIAAVVGDLQGYFVGVRAPVVKCRGGVRVTRRNEKEGDR